MLGQWPPLDGSREMGFNAPAAAEADVSPLDPAASPRRRERRAQGATHPAPLKEIARLKVPRRRQQIASHIR